MEWRQQGRAKGAGEDRVGVGEDARMRDEREGVEGKDREWRVIRGGEGMRRKRRNGYERGKRRERKRRRERRFRKVKGEP